MGARQTVALQVSLPPDTACSAELMELFHRHLRMGPVVLKSHRDWPYAVIFQNAEGGLTWLVDEEPMHLGLRLCTWCMPQRVTLRIDSVFVKQDRKECVANCELTFQGMASFPIRMILYSYTPPTLS